MVSNQRNFIPFDQGHSIAPSQGAPLTWISCAQGRHSPRLPYILYLPGVDQSAVLLGAWQYTCSQKCCCNELVINYHLVKWSFGKFSINCLLGIFISKGLACFHLSKMSLFLTFFTQNIFMETLLCAKYFGRFHAQRPNSCLYGTYILEVAWEFLTPLLRLFHFTPPPIPRSPSTLFLQPLTQHT